MKSRLGWYLGAKRRAHGLTVEALAVRLGYRDVKKGIQRIQCLEHHGRGPAGLLINLADTLGINYATILDLVERDAASGAQPAVSTQRWVQKF